MSATETAGSGANLRARARELADMSGDDNLLRRVPNELLTAAGRDALVWAQSELARTVSTHGAAPARLRAVLDELANGEHDLVDQAPFQPLSPEHVKVLGWAQTTISAALNQTAPPPFATDAELRTAVHDAIRAGIEAVRSGPADRDVVRSAAAHVLALEAL